MPPRKGTQTLSELRELQRLAATAIMRPLGRGWDTQRTWLDGRDMCTVAATFIKPNDRLTSFERLAIYNRQYWYRIVDCFYDDFPGLRAVLGEQKFSRLSKAYLAKYPSRSYTLRNLGSRLGQFIQDEPQWTAPRNELAADMVRFEWAQVIAFDSETKPPLSVDDLLGKNPDSLRLGLQPYLTLLRLGYPLDDFVLALKKKDALRGEASNAIEEDAGREKRRRTVRLPRRQEVFVAIHRFENSLYYKRLEPEAYRLLVAVRDGATLSHALAAGFGRKAGGDVAGIVKEWFETWTSLGWFCQRR